MTHQFFSRTYSCVLPIIRRSYSLFPHLKQTRVCLTTHRSFSSTSSDSIRVEQPLQVACVPPTKAEYLQKLLLQQTEQAPPDARTLKVAVIGCPNAGKSSLVNMLIKWRVCAVSGKAHTTRSKQMAALYKNNIQIVFVDLPGIINKSKIRPFNLEKSFIRDPHAATFESDLIMIVVDVSHARSRSELDPEIVKALHFFEDKESILVLNKIDLARSDPTRLLDITRRLTRGTVNGRQWHLDAYQARFNRRASLAPTAPMIQPPSEVIAAYLPPVCHHEANKLLQRLAEIRARLNPPIEPDNQVHLVNSGSTQNAAIPLLTEGDSKAIDSVPSQSTASCDPTRESDRLVTEVEIQSIKDYFAKYKPQSNFAASPKDPHSAKTGEDDVPTEFLNSDDKESSLRSNDALQAHELKMLVRDDPYLDSLLDTLKRKLLLHSANPEEVTARRQRWLDVSVAVQGVTDWPGFSAVFMVSSANGDGVDSLRDYLLERAIPGRPWLMSPSLVTDQEPSEIVRMCVWAHCLDRLHQEIPYSLRIVVDACEKAHLNDGDDRVFVHARIQCRTERHLRQLLGIKGSTITELASAVKHELMTIFRTNVVVKLTGEMATIRPNIRHKLRKARDFGEVFPEQARSAD